MCSVVYRARASAGTQDASSWVDCHLRTTLGTREGGGRATSDPALGVARKKKGPACAGPVKFWERMPERHSLYGNRHSMLQVRREENFQA